MSLLKEPCHIIVVGAGVQGLGAAIRLLEEGHYVTLLEANATVGQGTSRRPASNPFAIVHSGVLFANGTRRQEYSKLVNRALLRPVDASDTLMRIFRANALKLGKLIVARSPQGVERLHEFAKCAEAVGAAHDLLISRNADGSSNLAARRAIQKLDEPLLANPDTTAGVLNLRNVHVINIARYIEDLRKTFEEKCQETGRGELKYSHEVTGFETPSHYALKDGPVDGTRRRGTGVICSTPHGRNVFYADAVLNMAGMHAAAVAEMASAALRRSKDQQLGANDFPPMAPGLQHRQLGVLVPNEKARINGMVPTTLHPVYVADNVVADGPEQNLGGHVYPGVDVNGRFATTVGPYSSQVPYEALKSDVLLHPEIIAKKWDDANAAMPGIADDRANWDFQLVGRVTRYFNDRGERDLMETHCTDKQTLFAVYSYLWGDTPGMTVSGSAANLAAEQIVLHVLWQRLHRRTTRRWQRRPNGQLMALTT